MNGPFDDYLQLSARRLARFRLVVFVGCSGAGKSSYLEFLAGHHRDLCEQATTRIEQGRPLTWSEAVPTKSSLIVIDEIQACIGRPAASSVGSLLSALLKLEGIEALIECTTRHQFLMGP